MHFEVFGQDDHKVLLSESLEGNALQTEKLLSDRVRDHEEPRSFLELGEVVDADNLGVALVGAAESKRELSFTAFLKLFTFLRLVPLVDLDDGPSDLRHRHTFECSTNFFELFRVVEANASLSEDLIQVIELGD